MKPFGYIVTVLVCATLLRALRRDFRRGLALAIALAIALPDSMRISAGFFELTIQRIIIVTVLPFWLRQLRAPKEAKQPVRLVTGLLLVGVVQFISLLASTRIEASAKDLLSYVIEVWLFYVIVATSVDDEETIRVTLRYVAAGVVAGALIATVEKYAGYNVQGALAYVSDVGEEDMGVVGCYSSRIMLGYAMAMGAAIWLCRIGEARARKAKLGIWLAIASVVSACYFSTSRGPWLGLAVGGCFLAVLGGPRPRKALIAVLVLASAVMMIRPGVKDTITDLYRGTFNDDSVKGKSYEYRWILWRVAYSEIKKSAWRTLFGYGGLSTEGMVLTSYFPHEGASSIGRLGYTSWDNNYASDLIEFGFVGFVSKGLLYATILWGAVRSWRRASPAMKDFAAGTAAACGVYLFAMSNVYIFSPQVKLEFWALAAVANGVGWAAGRVGRELAVEDGAERGLLGAREQVPAGL